jgi:hypothetical protein
VKMLLHWLVHRLDLNQGYVETWWDEGRLMVGFKCDGCGRIQGAHESHTTRQLDRILGLRNGR